MPGAYTQESRDDVVQMDRSRENGVTIAQIPEDFGVHEMTLHKWMRQVGIDDDLSLGQRPASDAAMLNRSQLEWTFADMT